MSRITTLSLIALLLAAATTHLIPPNNQATMVQIGSHKMFLNCTVKAPGPTVILEAGTGDSSEVWNAVQSGVEKFASVCSYDRLGLGRSDKLAVAHTADEIVADLHGLLHVASIREPYILVAHSIGGIYARKYADLYPAEVAGMVLVDSAHEEQFTRVAHISPEWAKRINSQFPVDEQRSQGFLVGNERLVWRFDKPLIAIEHGGMPPSAASDPMAKQSEVVFHVLQKDLAGRSKYGQLREAKTSGHYIQRDQPELVTQSIRDVMRESATTIPTKPTR